MNMTNLYLVAMQVGGFDPAKFGATFWMAMTILVVIVCVILAIVHERVVLPPIARKMRSAKWSKGSLAFVQDDVGVVHLTISDVDLPEGVTRTKRGWFLRSRSPYIPERNLDDDKTLDEETKAELKKIDDTVDARKKHKLKMELIKKLEKEGKLTEKIIGTILQTPILEGLGKSVFFGYDGTALLSNLKTIAHADLRIMKEVIPATISRTQLGALAKWSLMKGYEKRGGDTNKLVILIACLIALVATVGIVFYALTQRGA
jgi:hypothetical protein